jgi:hypothetical protein
MMTPNFPIWMTIVLALQMLSAFALAVLLWIFGSMFDGTLGLGNTVLIGFILLSPLLCWWLARSRWQAGKHGLAKALAFSPILIFGVLFTVFALVVDFLR